MTHDDLLPLFRAHGDRTSSLAALGPQFSTFAPPGGGAVRYVDLPGARVLSLLFRHWRLGYNFRSLHEFKDKFHPTRWDPLFLASTSGSLARALAETDYGSSNAVFALAGALAGLLRRGSRILVPFALYGLFICLARESWLALHHLVTLAAGVPLGRLRGARRRAGPS